MCLLPAAAVPSFFVFTVVGLFLVEVWGTNLFLILPGSLFSRLFPPTRRHRTPTPKTTRCERFVLHHHTMNETQLPQQPELEEDMQLETNRIHLQNESSFFQILPQEIRDHVYTQLFSSTRFIIHERLRGPLGASLYSTPDVRCAPNGLALLLTCHRAWFEIGGSWVRHVLFSFETITAMLDTLTILPRHILSNIRHLRVNGDSFSIYVPGQFTTTYPIASAFKLLPGLQLDQLTVLGGHAGQINYQALDSLIREGSGWKTLRYLCRTSEVLGFPSDRVIKQLVITRRLQDMWRKPQPRHWQSVLEHRDGATSAPSVTVYRAKETAVYQSVLQASKWERFEQKPRDSGLGWQPGQFPADPRLAAKDEQRKEMMVVVKRGDGVDYQEKEGSPFLQSDMRRDYPDVTWDMLWDFRYGRFVSGRDPSLPPVYEWPHPEWGDRAVDDVYEDVDEYRWSWLPHCQRYDWV